MLTRLKVNGFKNLLNTDIRFGAFTCIAGTNGVGKSNLFDAIRFLSALADKPLIEAALSVRDEVSRATSVRDLFYRSGNVQFDEMSFEAEMIIPAEGYDELNQKAEASITFLRYELILQYTVEQHGLLPQETLKIKHESLTHINISDAAHELNFPHSKKYWRDSVIKGRRTASPFISTEGDLIRLHQDGTSGRPRPVVAASKPRA